MNKIVQGGLLILALSALWLFWGVDNPGQSAIARADVDFKNLSKQSESLTENNYKKEYIDSLNTENTLNAIDQNTFNKENTNNNSTESSSSVNDQAKNFVNIKPTPTPESVNPIKPIPDDSRPISANQNSNNTKEVVKRTVSAKASRGAFTATAYCLSGKTALGHKVRRGIIAADPRILKLGSRVYVNAGPYSGTYLVSDTGGAVRGRKIDIWMPSCAEARRFGRRTVTIGDIQAEP
jgi:3D (Asp-Asp-Asp) domain-containing protein